MLITTILRDHHPWIQSHITTGKDGRLQCAATEGEILSRVHHFYRLGSQDPHAPYVPEKSLLSPDRTTPGSMVSFVTFGCKACDSHLETPKQVSPDDLMWFNKM